MWLIKYITSDGLPNSAKSHIKITKIKIIKKESKLKKKKKKEKRITRINNLINAYLLRSKINSREIIEITFQNNGFMQNIPKITSSKKICANINLVKVSLYNKGTEKTILPR